MTYQQTLDYLFNKLPMFTNIGASAIKKDLTNTLAFCEVLDHPQNKIKTIHVGGTNGKGSTSHMLAAILQEAGYKTGLYTSPHLKDFRERIRINGEVISEEKVISFVDKYHDDIERISPSFFEATFAMALQHFAEEKVDIAVIEVGLGGRLDSTNIIKPEVSVITNIGFDHMNILGNTIEEIAFEKAGIIKKETPIIIGEYTPKTKNIFSETAKKNDAEITFAQDEYEVLAANRDLDYLTFNLLGREINLDLKLDLTGTYQLKNIKTVIATVEKLNELGFSITKLNIVSALKKVKQLTGLMGRWQILALKPLTICDTGHNKDGIQEVLKNIHLTPHLKLHIVIGMVKDKDVSRILSMLPKKAQYYFCAPQLLRAKPAAELAAEAKKLGLAGFAYNSVKEALNAAKNVAKENDLIFIGGSTFVVAEVV